MTQLPDVKYRYCPQCEFENHELKILNEKPYNWRKHFIFELPDLFYFLVKIAIIFGLTSIITTATLESMTETLPVFCEMLYEP